MWSSTPTLIPTRLRISAILRNAVLGDTLVRLLRRSGRLEEVQNYIDNTGVQVADVVVGFQHMEGKSADEVRALAAAPPLRLCSSAGISTHALRSSMAKKITPAWPPARPKLYPRLNTTRAIFPSSPKSSPWPLPAAIFTPWNAWKSNTTFCHAKVKSCT